MSEADPLAELQRRNAQLERELSAATELARALAVGQIDAVMVGPGAPPLLLLAAQKKLLEREQMLRAIFDGSLDAMLLADDDGKYVDANPAACELFGLAKIALLGRSITDFAGPSYEPVDEWKTFIEKGHLRGEVPLIRADGSPRALELAAVANIIPGVHLSVLRDVTQRHEREAALRETQYFLEQAQTIAQIGCWVAPLEATGRLFWTAEQYRIAGLPDGSPITINAFFDLVHPDDRDAVRLANRTAAIDGSPFQIEHRIIRPDGEIRWLHAQAIVERDAAGVPRRMIGTSQDVTDRRRDVAELRASEERYRRIIETTSQGVWVTDASFVTTFVNQPMADMLGYARSEMLGRPVLSFLTAEGRAKTEAQLALRGRGISASYENVYPRKDGTIVNVRVSSNALFDDAGKMTGAVSLFSDMTEQRKFEDARNRLAAIVDSSEDAIVSKTLAGIITSWNHAAEKLFGYTADEIVGRPTTVLIPPDRADEEPAILASLAGGKRIENFDTVRRRKDGSLVEVSLLISLIRDGEGRIVGASKIARDITGRRKQEEALRRSEGQLRQAQKMEAIGSLAGGIAHDFNNLLSVILSYTSLLMEGVKPNDPLRADLEEVEKAGLRAADLTRQLLAFSRQQMLEPHVLDLNTIVTGIEKMLVRMLGEDVTLVLDIEQELGKVYADSGQIEQVLMNLAINARDAMPCGGSLTIETSDVLIGVERGTGDDGLPPGSYVLLAVTDTGIGMDEATRERIFEPFFTTKPEGKGTGLGLSTVYGIVEQSGGHLRVHSSVGVGTTFKSFFPRTDREAPSRSLVPASGPTSYRGTETILLVEDEEQVRIVVRSVLRKLGYHVLEAQNGGEAFLISEQHGATIHLLLTDVVMPRMSGRELADRLLIVRPEMKVLYVSGYTKDATVHYGVHDSGKAFLQKPLTPMALATKVRELLDAGSTHGGIDASRGFA